MLESDRPASALALLTARRMVELTGPAFVRGFAVVSRFARKVASLGPCSAGSTWDGRDLVDLERGRQQRLERSQPGLRLIVGHACHVLVAASPTSNVERRTSRRKSITCQRFVVASRGEGASSGSPFTATADSAHDAALQPRPARLPSPKRPLPILILPSLRLDPARILR